MIQRKSIPDTSTFHYYNRNPKNRITTDCIIRAISTALEMPYETVVMELAQFQCVTGYDDGDKKGFSKYLESKGFTMKKQPRKQNNTKYTGKEFCTTLQNEDAFGLHDNKNRIIANIGSRHIVAIMDCKVYDIWDSTDGCIGNYWVKE